jgi:integrase/recombinase XerC
LDTLAQLGSTFITHHQAMGRSLATIRHYQDSLQLLTRCCAAEGIPATSESLTAATMNCFAGWLRTTPTRQWRGKTERSIWGVHGALKDIKAFVRFLEAEELIDKAPKVPVPKLPTVLFPVLTEADLELIFASRHLSGTSEIAIRNRALVAFMLDTGVRLSEASGLRVGDVSIKDGAAKIRGKGNKERMVYFSEGATDSLKRWIAIRGEGDEPLFWLESGGIRMLFNRIKADTGLAMFTPHQVRHTAFTMLVRANVDLHTIKRLAGHASVTTTEAYLSLAGEDLKAKHNVASPFDAINRKAQPVKTDRRRLKAS